MPIISKREADARRARAAEAAKQAEAAHLSDDASPPVDPSHQQSVKPVKTKRTKKQPTGDYPVGYCRPPEQNRFTSESPKSPGRGRGRRSQDSIRRDLLIEKREISIAGKTVKRQTREALELVRLKKALSADGPHLATWLADASRLFPDQVKKQQQEDESAGDAEILALFSRLSGGGVSRGAPVMQIDAHETGEDPEWDHSEESSDAILA